MQVGKNYYALTKEKQESHFIEGSWFLMYFYWVSKFSIVMFENIYVANGWQLHIEGVEYNKI